MNFSRFFLVLLVFGISCQQHSTNKMADGLKDNAIKKIKLKEFSSAIDAAKEALEIYENSSDTLGLIESNYLIARASALSGDLGLALEYGKKAGHLIQTTGNYTLEYKINNLLIFAYSSIGADIKENLDCQKRQIYVVEQLNDDEAKAMVYNNYAYDGTVAGTLHLDSLIDYSKFANDYYAKTEKNYGRWYTLMNLTWQYRLQHDFINSEKYGWLAVAQAEIDKDRHAIIEANTNLGETLLVQHKLEKAHALYERGLVLSDQKADRDKYVFDVYYSRYLWLIGKQQEAISILKTAIDFLKTDEIFYEMLGRAYLSEFSFKIKDIEESRNQLTFFKNRRADFYSLESKTIVSMIEAQLLLAQDADKAIKILKAAYDELEVSGSNLYKYKISNLIEKISD